MKKSFGIEIIIFVVQQNYSTQGHIQNRIQNYSLLTHVPSQ